MPTINALNYFCLFVVTTALATASPINAQEATQEKAISETATRPKTNNSRYQRTQTRHCLFIQKFVDQL